MRNLQGEKKGDNKTRAAGRRTLPQKRRPAPHNGSSGAAPTRHPRDKGVPHLPTSLSLTETRSRTPRADQPTGRSCADPGPRSRRPHALTVPSPCARTSRAPDSAPEGPRTSPLPPPGSAPSRPTGAGTRKKSGDTTKPSLRGDLPRHLRTLITRGHSQE